jgi:glucuronoarabinoxylan endo-1,4-beta-xylanase
MKVFIAFLLICFGATAVFAQSATITWGTTYQTIAGFGAANHGYEIPLTAAQAEFLFSPTPGNLGLSLLRIAVTEDGSCTSVNEACAATPDYVSDATYAASYGVRVFATPWTPPAQYKTNNNIACTAGEGKGTLVTSDYAAYATYLSNFVTSLQNYYNINLYALSPQNEPESCTSYDSSIMSAGQLDTFIKNNLGPTIAANNPGVMLIMPEANADTGNGDSFTAYAGTCMTDAACSQYTPIIAAHAYVPTIPSSVSNPYSLPGWMTETSDAPSYGIETCPGYVWCPGISDAMQWAKYIDVYMSSGWSAWVWWAIFNNCGTTCNSGLYGGTNDSTLATRAYVLGQYSQFIRPGWVRIDATHAPQTNVTVTAYKNAATGAFAIVATNQNTSSVSQEFSFSGISPTGVTPTTTSATQNLATGSSVTVSGSAFTYTLPAQSVVTFSGSATESASKPAPPVAPTGLAASVQ